MGLPSTSYFLCLRYFELAMAHSHFSSSHTAHEFAASLFPGSFKPVCFLKAYLFISWTCDPLFLPLGLNGFSILLPTLFCPCCWTSSFYSDSQNDHQQLAKVFYFYYTILVFVCDPPFFYFQRILFAVHVTYPLQPFHTCSQSHGILLKRREKVRQN